MPTPLPESGDERIRQVALRALEAPTPSGAGSTLAPCGAGKDGRMRKEATEALAELGGEEARAARVRALVES